MDRRRLQFIIASVLFFAILYFLPIVGNALRNSYVRAYAFFQNVGMAQEFGKVYADLEEAKRNLAARDALVSELQSENAFLRERLKLSSDSASPELLLARVIGKGSGFGEETLVINRGTDDGLSGGEAALLSPNTLAGVVDEISGNRAIVKLLFDSNFILNAKTTEGITGVIKGETGNKMVFDEVSQADKLLKDTLIVTDGADGRVPPNIPIGRIEEILSKPTDVFQRARVTPLFDSKHIERVFVTLSAK